MFLPEVFNLTESERILSDIAKNSFGLLISAGDSANTFPLRRLYQ